MNGSSASALVPACDARLGAASPAAAVSSTAAPLSSSSPSAVSACAAAECIEVRVYWGARLLHSAYVPHGQRYVVGEGPAAELPMAAQQLGVARLELVNARGEVTLLRDGAVARAQRLEPSERQRMSRGMLRFELASTTLPQMSPAERWHRRAQLMRPLLLAVVAVVVALPLALPLALGHELTPPPDEPSEEQRMYIYNLMPAGPELDESAPQAKSMVPNITVAELPATSEPSPWEEEPNEAVSLPRCSLGSVRCSPIWIESSVQMPPAVARYDLIELPDSGLSEHELHACLPRYDPFAESPGTPPEPHGDQIPIPRCTDASVLGPHAQDGPPSFIDWDVLSWPKRNPAQLSGLGIGDNAAARRSRSLATLNAPEPRRQLDEIRFRTCMSASWHRYDRWQARADCLAAARPTGS